MIKIGMSKKYRYRNGEPARILCVDGHNMNHPVISMSADGQVHMHTENGVCVASDFAHKYDLFEITPYDDFKIDEPVMVKSLDSRYGCRWVKRYFAGVAEDGRPLTWAEGRTSWTAYGRTNLKTPWDKCRKPTLDELGE